MKLWLVLYSVTIKFRHAGFGLVCLWAVIGATPCVFAGERYEFYNGIRGLGMGGAQVATVNDETALVLNPAALGRLRNYFFTVADPEIEASAGTYDIFESEFMDAADPQQALAANRARPGDRFHQRAQVFPSFVAPNFGLGILGKREVKGSVNSQTDEFNYFYRQDYALVSGFALRLWGGRIKIGATGRLINRSEIVSVYPTDSTDLTFANEVREGIGLAGDGALMITMPWRYLPTLAAVWRDIGYTQYTVRDGLFNSTDERPDYTRQSIDVGMSIQPIIGRGQRMTLALEYRELNHIDEEEDHFRRAHAGLEFNFIDMFFLRAGMHQRYWTAGFEISVDNYQLQIATYGEEVGTVEDTEEDRRYAAKFAFRF